MKKTKNKPFITILLLLATLVVGCQENNSISAGASTLPDNDIRVMSDTFAVTSQLDSCVAISLTPDSFLLGECDTHFGTIKADILTQLACPEGFVYPGGETAVVDSICLYLYYKNWYGDGKTPLGITVYEMDKQSLQENASYPNNLQISDYCSLAESAHIVTDSKIVVPATPSDSSYSSQNDTYVPTIRIKLTDEFAKRFFAIKDFSSQKAFNQLFKGLYICSDFNASNVLYINDITMTVFYHFTMNRAQLNDTIIHDTRSFYANEEVRQVNRFTYPNRQSILQQYSQVKDTNYIVSPANIYTELTVQMDEIYNRIDAQLGDTAAYRVYINRADLTVDVLYSDSVTGRPRDNWDTPASYMMLIQKENMAEFFSTNKTPSDSVAIITSLSATTDSLSNVIYQYSYDLSGMLTKQIRSEQKVDQLTFVLVPVAITTNSSTGAILSVKPLQTISATCIRSANNPDIPMDIEVVYAGFSKTRQGL
jgi:hypothetical protein